MTKNVKVNYKKDHLENNKKTIIIICGILVAIALVIGLILLLTKKDKDPVEPKTPDNQGGNVVITDPEDKPDVKPVIKKVNNEKKEETKTIYRKVTFYYGEKSHTVKVVDGKLVSKYVPTGYTECEYYTDEEYQNVFDFNQKINNDIAIYIKSLITNYTIVYNLDNHGNPVEYSVDLGEIYLDNPSVDGVFLGWYLDEEHNNRIYELNEDISTLADENNVLNVYGYVTDKVVINYYDRDGNKLGEQEITSDMEHVTPDDYDDSVSEDERMLGFSEDNDNTIEYNYNQEIDLSDEEMSLYVVSGVTKVDYINNENLVVEVGYNVQELDEYVLPTAEDLELDAPTYYDLVENETLDSLLIVENDKDEILDTEIKLSDVEGHTGDWYTPQVGDNVVEKEMTFDGWLEQRFDSDTEEIIEQKVTDDYKPPVNEDIILTATWTIDEPANVLES